MLTMKDVIREGHPTLALRAKDVKIPLSEHDKKTLKLMMEFLINSQTPEISEEYELRPGVGIAAPQINISKKMIAILTTDEKDEKLYKMLLVNPKIVSHSVKKTYLPGGEGCLSVDREVEGLVLRHKKIRVKGFSFNEITEELIPVDFRVEGYVGIVIQHEIDHLNGILFPEIVTENVDGIDPVVFPIQEDIEE
jgi:peptide deformylase